MKQLVRNAKIIGTGSYVPEKIYTNEYIETIAPTSARWVYENVGIKKRHIAAENQATSDLAAIAGQRAIDDAGLKNENIDLIIVATSTPDRKAPSTAAFVQHKLNAFNAAAFDITAVCSGFLFGLSVASQYIASGVYNNVLIIGADVFSKITDWTRRDCIFFGDGAGAAIITTSDTTEGFLAYRLYTDTQKDMLGFTIPGGGSEIPLTAENIHKGLQYFQMNGKAVFESASKVLPKAINQVLSDTGLSVDDIDIVIPHQPSIRILKNMAESLNLPFEKVMHNMEDYANTSGGTIPILLDECNKRGQLKKGDIILFAAVGSGWTYGASIIKWAK
jgi:3-oxoacyl-[acyl-carrier-protein] synthase-3